VTNINPVWDVLASQANSAVLKAEARLEKFAKHKQKIVVRQEKISALLVEYSNHSEKIQSNGGSGEIDNSRKFIAQLMDLRNRTHHEYINVEADYGRAKKALILANQEKLKADFLSQREKEIQHQLLVTKEKRELELQGITQFNLKR